MERYVDLPDTGCSINVSFVWNSWNSLQRGEGFYTTSSVVPQNYTSPPPRQWYCFLLLWILSLSKFCKQFLPLNFFSCSRLVDALWNVGNIALIISNKTGLIKILNCCHYNFQPYAERHGRTTFNTYKTVVSGLSELFHGTCTWKDIEIVCSLTVRASWLMKLMP